MSMQVIPCIVPPNAYAPKRQTSKRTSVRKTQKTSQANPFESILEKVRNNNENAPFESEEAVFAWWNKNKSSLRI